MLSRSLQTVHHFCPHIESRIAMNLQRMHPIRSMSLFLASCYIFLLTNDVMAFTVKNHHNNNLSSKNRIKSFHPRFRLSILKDSPSSYENSDSSSKGIVSSLTNIVNFVMGSRAENNDLEREGMF